MRELRYVGVGLEDGSLVVESDGERFRLRVDEDVRSAVTGRGRQLAIPVESALSPREIQDRLRHGASSIQLAEATGVPVESIARFEGPVLAERAHHARMAQAADIDGHALGDVVADHLAAAGLDPLEAEWDAWRRADESWLVQVSWDETERRRSARWSWVPATRRLRPLDPQSQAMLRQAGDDDELTAVLRPVRSAQLAPPPLAPALPAPTPMTAVEPELPTEPEPPLLEAEPPILDLDQVSDVEPDPDAAPHESDPDREVAERRPVRPARKQRRVSVPSWDEIATGRRSDPSA